MKNTKKVLSVALAGALAFGSMGAAFAAVPSDVKGTDYEKAVERLGSLDVLKGYEDGTFKADKTITRAEFAAVVVRALGLEASAKSSMGATGYNDVAKDHWAAGYINIASGLKVINGIGDGKFAPEAPVKYEEAVTMIVRALGYEPAAQAKGGYPNGYLVIAGQEDITDGVKGAIGLAAPRGIVAQLVDNSLEVAMMVQVGYGSDAKFVKSGTDGTTKETLLDTKLDVEFKEDIVSIVNKDDGKIKVGAKEIEVPENFNFKGLDGVKIKAYYNDDDELVSYEVKDTVLYDAVEINIDGTTKEVELKGLNKTYKVATTTRENISALLVDNKEYEYAKVVIDNGRIVDLEVVENFDGYISVEKVDKEVISGHGEELNLKDYDIMKDGKEIKASDLQKGDIVFYKGGSTKFAEVYNKSIKGKVEEVLSDSLKINGTEYSFAGAFYLDEDGEKATTNIEDKIYDIKGKETTIFVDRQGDAVLVDVDIDSAATSTIVGYLKDGSIKKFDNRGKSYYAIDIVNKEGKEVSYDVEVEADLIAGTELVDSTTGIVYFDKDADTSYDAGEEISGVVELKLDKDAKVDEIKQLTSAAITNVKVKDTKYAAGYKLDGNAVVFNTEKYATTDEVKDIKINTWSKADFDTAKTGTIYVQDGVVKYMVVTDADKDSEETTTNRALVTEVKKVSGENELRIKAYVDGVEKVFYTDTNEKITIEDINGDSATGLDMNDALALVGKVISIDVDKDTGMIVNTSALTRLTPAAINNTATIKVANKEIIDGTTTYRLLSDAKVFDITDKNNIKAKSLSDANFTNYDVTVVVDETGSTFVKYVLLTAK